MINLDLRKIEKMIDMLSNTDVTEIEIREGEVSVRISRGQKSLPLQSAPLTYVSAHQSQPSAVVSGASTQTETKSASEKQPNPADDKHTIRSPMVGTFYLSPSPEAKAFVEIGQHVKAGDVLCIVEAMKMMNQIESDKDGILTARLVENGSPVEFDQPLFVIE
jgi:acetyl-CoA carboxylase biotin carboxyl carrier protein